MNTKKQNVTSAKIQTNILDYHVEDWNDPVFKTMLDEAVADFEKQLAKRSQDNSNT